MKLLQKYFLPTSYVENFELITPRVLKEMNVKAVLTDLDNTLIGYDEPQANEAVIRWFEMLNEHDIKVTIVSNGNKVRVSEFCNPHEIDYIYSARKPLSKSYRKAVRLMGVGIEDTVMIGDQLMTDVLGANRINMKSILVIPVKNKDGMATYLNRRAEKFIMGFFNRRGLLSKEDE